jgi:hypothetical protein
MKNSVQEPIMHGEVTVEVENPVEVLRDQDGTFKVTSPYGYIFRVTCRKGRNMRVREIGNAENAPLPEVAHHDRFDGSGYKPTARRWQIAKIA